MADRPRIIVPLSQEAYDAISTIAEYSGTPRGRIISEALEAAVPAYIAIATAFRAAKAVEGEERQAIIDSMEASADHLLAAFEKTGLPHGLDDQEAGNGRDASDATRAVRAEPPDSNRGVPTSRKGGLQ